MIRRVIFLLHVGKIQFGLGVNQIQRGGLAVIKFQRVQIFGGQVPFNDVAQIFIQLGESKRLRRKHGLNCVGLVFDTVSKRGSNFFVSGSQLVGIFFGEIFANSPQRVNHLLARELVPLDTQIVHEKIFGRVQVNAQRVVANQKRAGRVVVNGLVDFDGSCLVIRRGSVFVQNNFQREVRQSGGAKPKQCS